MTVSPAQLRKARSIAMLEQRGIPTLDWLPVIGEVEESHRRTTEEVARRALALAIVATKGSGHATDPPEDVAAFIPGLVDRYGVTPDLTPDERIFMDTSEPREFDYVQFAWRYEACWALMWSLGFVDRLEFPAGICDISVLIAIIMDRGRDGFIADADLRPQAAIFDETDFIFRLHWATRDADLKGGAVEGVEPGVVMERHHALNWLADESDIGWDDVSTPT